LAQHTFWRGGSLCANDTLLHGHVSFDVIGSAYSCHSIRFDSFPFQSPLQSILLIILFTRYSPEKTTSIIGNNTFSRARSRLTSIPSYSSARLVRALLSKSSSHSVDSLLIRTFRIHSVISPQNPAVSTRSALLVHIPRLAARSNRSTHIPLARLDLLHQITISVYVSLPFDVHHHTESA
jgi:hypothetical protein